MEREKGLIGDAIRAKRMALNISQEELSEMVGITPTHMKHIESEHRNPSIDVLLSMVKILRLSLDDLLFTSEAENSAEYREAALLLKQCSVKQLKVLIAAMRAMLDSA